MLKTSAIITIAVWSACDSGSARLANGARVRTSQRKLLVVLTARDGSGIHLLLPLLSNAYFALGLPLWWCGLLLLSPPNRHIRTRTYSREVGREGCPLPYADSCGFAASPIAFIVGPTVSVRLYWALDSVPDAIIALPCCG